MSNEIRYSEPGAPLKLPGCHQGDHSPQVWNQENPCSSERAIPSPLWRGVLAPVPSSWSFLIQELIICQRDGTNAFPFCDDSFHLYDHILRALGVVPGGFRKRVSFGWPSLEAGWGHPPHLSFQCHVPPLDLVGWQLRDPLTLTMEGNSPLRNWILYLLTHSHRAVLQYE